MFPLHGNPGDYAWGANGIDDVITQVIRTVLKLFLSFEQATAPVELDRIILPARG